MLRTAAIRSAARQVRWASTAAAPGSNEFVAKRAATKAHAGGELPELGPGARGGGRGPELIANGLRRDLESVEEN